MAEKKAYRRNTEAAHQASRKYKNAAQLQAAVDKYFEYCEAHDELTGEEGLAYHLDISVQTLYAWYDGTQCPDLQETVIRAFDKSDYLNSIDPRFMDKAMASRYIFQKKQRRHGGWQDKQEVACDAKFEVTIKDYDKELAK